MIDIWWRHDLSRAAERCRWSRAARPFWICVAKWHLPNAIDNPDWLTAQSSQCQPLTAELRAPRHLCSALHFRLLMGVYFLMVHGRSLLVSDRYWIADLEAADFTGPVRSNFGWIVRPLQFMVQHFGFNWSLLFYTGRFIVIYLGSNLVRSWQYKKTRRRRSF